MTWHTCGAGRRGHDEQRLPAGDEVAKSAEARLGANDHGVEKRGRDCGVNLTLGALAKTPASGRCCYFGRLTSIGDCTADDVHFQHFTIDTSLHEQNDRYHQQTVPQGSRTSAYDVKPWGLVHPTTKPTTLPEHCIAVPNGYYSSAAA